MNYDAYFRSCARRIKASMHFPPLEYSQCINKRPNSSVHPSGLTVVQLRHMRNIVLDPSFPLKWTLKYLPRQN